jgi:hypothetical protein
MSSIHRLAAAAPRAAVILLAACSLLAPPPASSAQPPWSKNKAYPDGQIVVITGTVTDSDGQPIPQVDLVLEAARRAFNVRRMRDVTEEPRQVRARTDDAGQYSVEWEWHHYYNAFDLAVVVPIGVRGGRERDEVIARVDLSDRIAQGTPVVVPVTVDDTRLLQEVRAFLADLDTDDERRIHTQEGKPDRVDQVARPDYDEETWWYFSIGALYRFRDGKLAEVENFEPVREFTP